MSTFLHALEQLPQWSLHNLDFVGLSLMSLGNLMVASSEDISKIDRIRFATVQLLVTTVVVALRANPGPFPG